jgi:hypothetical protein
MIEAWQKTMRSKISMVSISRASALFLTFIVLASHGCESGNVETCTASGLLWFRIDQPDCGDCREMEFESKLRDRQRILVAGQPDLELGPCDIENVEVSKAPSGILITLTDDSSLRVHRWRRAKSELFGQDRSVFVGFSGQDDPFGRASLREIRSVIPISDFALGSDVSTTAARFSEADSILVVHKTAESTQADGESPASALIDELEGTMPLWDEIERARARGASEAELLILIEKIKARAPRTGGDLE